MNDSNRLFNRLFDILECLKTYYIKQIIQCMHFTI